MALDLNYKPIALVDTSTLTEEEWLAWRKKGIGGSDVAAALHLSPYKTARDLYFDKIGVEPTVEQPDKSITFAIGARRKILCKRFSTKSRMALENRADSGLDPLITESHGGQNGMCAGTA